MWTILSSPISLSLPSFPVLIFIFETYVKKKIISLLNAQSWWKLGNRNVTIAKHFSELKVAAACWYYIHILFLSFFNFYLFIHVSGECYTLFLFLLLFFKRFVEYIRWTVNKFFFWWMFEKGIHFDWLESVPSFFHRFLLFVFPLEKK